MQAGAKLTALLSAALIAACESGTSSGPPPIDFDAPPAPSSEGFAALYAPPVDVGPYPNDIYNAPGATLSVPEKITRPLAAALNTLDGFSTIAPITAPFNAPLDAASLVPFDPLAPDPAANVFVLDATNGAPLVPGLDYEVGIADAAGSNGAILELVPVAPLSPETTYVFVLTNGIRSTAGAAAAPDTVFGLVRDAHLGGVMTGNPDLDALLPAIGPLIDAAVALGVPGDAIVSAWSVSTQSIGRVLEHIAQAAAPQAAALAPMGIDTSDLGLGLPGIADLYTGFLEIPYYQDPEDPLGSFWVNSDIVPPTRENPVPVPQGGQLRIPVLASAPNAASGAARPADGWPVAILQHGVRANRTILVTLADAFAQAGFALIAIDLPLHGVTDVNSPFYHAPGNAFESVERHFNLDNVGNVGDTEPDGLIDDGWQIFNVANPLNARDHGRQAVADLIHLLRTLPTMDLDGDAAPDFDASAVHFVSVSLGSMFSMPFLALEDDGFGAATMASPGGPYSAFLYDDDATDFGLPIRAGIEAEGLAFGTLAFDEFARDLQTVLDPIDPLNHAALAAQNHPVHVIEVLGDTAVPPALTERIAALMGLADVSETTTDPGGVRGIVRFTQGGHTSIFNPSVDRDVTEEMQRQAAGFAASGGTVLPVENQEVVQ